MLMRHSNFMRMHLLASMRACFSLSSPKIMNGLETSADAGSPPGKTIGILYSSDTESSSGIRNSSCTWAKTKMY